MRMGKGLVCKRKKTQRGTSEKRQISGKEKEMSTDRQTKIDERKRERKNNRKKKKRKKEQKVTETER